MAEITKKLKIAFAEYFKKVQQIKFDYAKENCNFKTGDIVDTTSFWAVKLGDIFGHEDVNEVPKLIFFAERLKDGCTITINESQILGFHLIEQDNHLFNKRNKPL